MLSEYAALGVLGLIAWVQVTSLAVQWPLRVPAQVEFQARPEVAAGPPAVSAAPPSPPAPEPLSVRCDCNCHCKSEPPPPEVNLFVALAASVALGVCCFLLGCACGSCRQRATAPPVRAQSEEPVRPRAGKGVLSIVQ